MSQGHTFNRRDKAEPRYRDIYEKHGGTWHPLPRGCGCDGLLLCDFAVEIVEHKSSEGSPLTESELALQEKCILAGVRYNIVDSEDAARILIADMKGERVNSSLFWE